MRKVLIKVHEGPADPRRRGCSEIWYYTDEGADIENAESDLISQYDAEETEAFILSNPTHKVNPEQDVYTLVLNDREYIAYYKVLDK